MNDSELKQQVSKLATLCRTCMSSSDNPFTSLFAVLSSSDKEDEPLSSILFKCTSIQVSAGDVLPQGICSSCLEKLAMCYLFRELCFDTQIKLYKLYEETQAINVNSNAKSIEPKNDKMSSSDFSGNFNSIIAEALDICNEKNETPCDLNYSDCDEPNSYDVLPIAADKKRMVNHINSGFSCDNCSKVFSSKYSLNRHIKIHQDPDELKCPLCTKKFTRAADVKRHLTTHTGEKPFICTICNSTFTQSGTLAAHMRRKHKLENQKALQKKTVHPETKPYACSICDKCFRHNSTLKMHLKRHMDIRPFECHTCNFRYILHRFVSNERLRSHMRIHTGERPFVCHICAKKFTHYSVLSRHIKAHEDIKPHKCSYCSRRFHVPYNLNIHLRQHTGEKPLKCHHCDKKFACPKTLKQHLHIHTDEKPHLCNNCGKSFRRSQHLKLHMKVHGIIQF